MKQRKFKNFKTSITWNTTHKEQQRKPRNRKNIKLDSKPHMLDVVMVETQAFPVKTAAHKFIMNPISFSLNQEIVLQKSNKVVKNLHQELPPEKARTK